MSLKNNQTFPRVRGLGWQEWLRSRKLSTCPLTPSPILRQGLGPLEAGENLGGSTGQLALFRGLCSGWLWVLALFSPGSCFVWADYRWGMVSG